jgi:hypothetical protein
MVGRTLVLKVCGWIPRLFAQRAAALDLKGRDDED